MDDRLSTHLELARLSDEEFVRRAYRLVLRREPEPAALDRAVSRATLIGELVASDEFRRLRALDEAITRGLARDRGRFLEGPAELDERVVEIPWALARHRGAERVLDCGIANADPVYVAALVARDARHLVGVDLAAVDIAGVETRVADLRALPFADASFDLALCISTLEHVGADNRVYGIDEDLAAQSHKLPAAQAEALAELQRVLGRDGRLVVTVPTGETEERGWFVQREPDAWNALFVEAGFRVLDEEIYERTPAGWRAATRFQPAGVRYGERGASAVLCAELQSRSAFRRLLRRRFR